MIRVACMISGNGGNLQRLLDMQDRYRVCLVIASRNNAYGILRARRSGIPALIIPKEIRSNKSEWEKWVLNELQKYKLDVLCLLGFMKILSVDFLKRCPFRIVNIHPSLLPKYKGADGFGETLASGDTIGGASFHDVVGEVDSGEIILQRGFEIPAEREENKSRLWLHINEQKLLEDGLKKIYGKAI